MMEVLSSASHKVKLFAKNCSKNSYLEDSLPAFTSRNNLKLHNISVTSKIVKKNNNITNLELSRASDPNCTSVVVLRNCEPELSYILAELFEMCLKKSCFPGSKVSLVVPVRVLWKYLQLKNTALLVFFLWLVKYLKNL